MRTFYISISTDSNLLSLRIKSVKTIVRTTLILLILTLSVLGYNDIKNSKFKETITLDQKNSSFLNFLAPSVKATSEAEVWQCGDITTSEQFVQDLFNNTWCDGYKRWLWEASGYNNHCGGEESRLKKEGCEGQIPNGCSQGQLPCNEDYPTNCTCKDGSSGTMICHKKGCSIGGVSGPTCSWSEGSYCEECKCLTPPPPPPCPLSTKDCVPCRKGEMYCSVETGKEYGFLGWACQNNNPGNIKYSQYSANLIALMGGTPPCGKKGTFMVFPTYGQGRESVKAFIKAINRGLQKDYPECGNCTLLYFFARYADDPFYATWISNRMGRGVTVNTKLNWIVENRLEDFVNAIQCTEGDFILSGGKTIQLCNI